MDKAGNISSKKQCTVSGIVNPVTSVIIKDTIIKKGKTDTIEKQTAGADFSSIQFTSSNTEVATVTISVQ